MATITANTGTNTWLTNGAWVGSVQPTAADDVVIPASAVINSTGGNLACRSLTIQSGGSFVNTNVNVNLNIGDATAGLGNVALSISSGATFSTSVMATNFISTSATQQTINTGGKSLSGVSISGAGSSYLLTSALTCASSFSYSAGTFNTGNFNLQCTTFNISSSTARTFTPGSSTITVTQATGNPIFNAGTVTNLVVTANTANVVFSGQTTGSIFLGGFNWNGMSLTLNSAAQSTPSITSGGATIKDLTWGGPATKTSTFAISGNITLTGALTWNSNANSAANRTLLSSGTIGTTTTITAASANISNVDLKDVTFSVSGTFTTSSIGNCGGNSGVTVTTPDTRYAVVAGNVSSTAMWSTTSNGAGGSSVPLPQDTVFFTSNSAAGTYTNDMPRWGTDVDFTGFTRTFSQGLTQEIYGSLTLAAGMTYSGSAGWQFGARTSETITCAGQTIGTSGVVFQGPGGTWTLRDALSTTGATTHTDGTVNTNGFSYTTTTFTSSGTRTRTLTLGASTVNLSSTAAATVWAMTATGLTVSASSSTIVISTASASTRVFTGAAFSYGTLTYTVASSPGQLTVSANYFATVNVGSGRIVSPLSSSTITIGAFNAVGQNNGYQEFFGSAGGGYYSAPDSAALSITGAIDVTVDATASGAQGVLLAKAANVFGGSPSTATYELGYTATTLYFQISNGTTKSSANFSAAASLDGTRRTYRGTWDGTTGANGIKLYVDGVLKAQGTSAFNAMQDTTQVVAIGGDPGGGILSNNGKIYRATIKNGIGGTTVFDADFTSKTFGANSFTESSSNAATVTASSSVAQAGDGRVIVQASTAGTATLLALTGPVSTNDYLYVKDINSVIPYKFYAGANSVPAPSSPNNTAVIFTDNVTQPYMTTEYAATSSGTTVTVTLPFSQSVTANDLIVLSWGTSSTAVTGMSAPAGYTLIDNTSTAGSSYLYYKIAAGGETGATFTTTSSHAIVSVRMMVISGWTGTPTVDVYGHTDSVAALTSQASNSLTNSAQPAYAIATWHASGSTGTFVSISNNWQLARSLVVASEQAAAIPLTSTGAQQTTFVWTSSRSSSTAVVIFKDVATTGNLRMLMGVGS